MTVHLQERLDLADGQVLPVAQRDQLVKGAQKLVRIAQDLPFIKCSACAGDDLGKEVKGIDVLKNVGLTIGDQDHVELIQWLVDESYVVLLHCSMLGARIS